MVETTGVNPRLDQILKIEAKYPVETWKINDVHIWPVLRTRIYIELAVEDLNARFDKNTIEEGRKEAQESGQKRRPTRLHLLLDYLHYLWFLIKPLKKSKGIFVTPGSYNDVFQGKYYHKFFDPIRLKSKDYTNSYIIEIGKSPSHQLRNTFHITDFDFLHRIHERQIRKKLLVTQLEKYDEFCAEVSTVTSLVNRFPKRAMIEAYYTIKKYEAFFDLFIRKTKAKEAFSLCYYLDSYVVFGMNLAAHKLDISSTDIQHGGQGPIHLAYCKYKRLPDSGRYEVMPKYFWCWDAYSVAEIEKWSTDPKSKHKAFVGGHPWLQFIKEQLNNQAKNELAVLHTLQPLGELIPESMIQTILATGKDVKWILRLHPRTKSRKGELEEVIHQNHLEEYIHPATFSTISLPESLALSRVHLSRWSGSIIEASIMGIPNIILDPIGVTSFIQWIEGGHSYDASELTPQQTADLIHQLIAKYN
ncbi:MAG: hypothetical protein K1X54_03910 [Flavobacteriales bacterium]|nr:hypothetical protein [Flavobacteriales bacterium]